MSLDRCACKRGFFTLRDCGRPAVTSCSSCTRRICQEHAAQGGLCVECAARLQEEAATVGAPLDPVRYREHWYASSGYSPVWWGTYDPYWSSGDYRWYDDTTDDDDDAGGFEDS